MTVATLSNLTNAALQMAIVALVAGAAVMLLRITSPQLGYLLWRAVLAACLLLPWVQSTQVQWALAPSPITTSVAATAEASAGGAPGAVESIDWRAVVMVVLAAGGMLRLAWLAAGLLRLRRLRTVGTPADDHQYAALQRRLGTRADVRYARAIRQPVTFGVRHPVVLLPDGLKAQAAATREAVLAHELVHVARRDWAAVVGEELVRAVLWFHPVMWWVISRVQLAREEVVDAAAVALTGRRREYVKALLAFADEVPLAPAPAFARRRHLFRRIVLLSTEGSMSSRRLVVSACAVALVVVVGGWSATRALPLQAGIASLIQAEPGPVERRAAAIVNPASLPARTFSEAPVFPPDAQAAGASGAITLRTAVDEAGNVAELRLGSVRFSGGGLDATVSAGPASLAELEQFLAKVTRQHAGATPAISPERLRPLLESFIESAALAARGTRYEPPSAGHAVVFDTVVEFSRNASPVSRDVPIVERLRGSDGALRVGGAVRTPVKVKDMKPVYPPDALAARVQGVVIAEIAVGADGRVADARILRSIPLLDQAALDAVTQWEFQPTLLNGVPTPVIMTVTIQFTLP